MEQFDIHVERISTAEQVARGLTDAIVRGHVPPGEALRENQLANRLGVSRNTLREAVRILERGGLVTYEFNRGAIVAEPSVENAIAIYAARRALEGAAARTLGPPEAIERVRKAFDEFRSAADNEGAADIVSYDMAFHASIVAMLDSSRIDEFFSQLANEIRFYLTVLVIEGREQERGEQLIAEHEPIVDAIVRGDADAAYRAVTEHLDVNVAKVVAAVQKRGTTAS